MSFIDGNTRSFPNNSAIGKGMRVVMSAGFLAVAGASDIELGTMEQQSQSTDKEAAVRLRTANGTRTMVANGTIAQFGKLFAAAGGKVSATGTLCRGLALEVASADGDFIEVLQQSSDAGKLFEQIVASTAVTNTTVETAFDQSYAFPANMLKAGDSIRIPSQGIATSTHSTDTLTIKLKVGATTIVSTAAVDVANNDIWYIDAILTIRTSGAGGTFVAAGTQSLGTPGAVTAKPFNLASTAIDTTATQAVTVTATWSVADATNSCRSDLLDIIKN